MKQSTRKGVRISPTKHFGTRIILTIIVRNPHSYHGSKEQRKRGGPLLAWIIHEALGQMAGGRANTMGIRQFMLDGVVLYLLWPLS